MKIKIMTVWFGKLPTSFLAWKKSVEFNKEIDFLIITDQTFSYCPDNLKTITESFDDFVNMVKLKLGSDVVLDRPYKICDYKPSFRFLFPDEFVGYDYWGYCDIDLVFGDLVAFFEKEKLMEYDRFLNFGHLCLFKNDPDKVEYFRMENGNKLTFNQAIHTTKSCYYDESPDSMLSIYKNAGLRQYNERIFKDISPSIHRFATTNSFGENRYKSEIYLWDCGKLYRYYRRNQDFQKEEIIYVHFQKRAMCDQVGDDSLWKATNRFILCKKGFINYSSEISMRTIIKYNCYPGKWIELFQSRRYRAKRWPELYGRKMMIRKTKNMLAKVFR